MLSDIEKCSTYQKTLKSLMQNEKQAQSKTLPDVPDVKSVSFHTIHRKRSRDIVSLIAGMRKFSDQQSVMAPTGDITSLVNRTDINAIRPLMDRLQSGSFLRAS